MANEELMEKVAEKREAFEEAYERRRAAAAELGACGEGGLDGPFGCAEGAAIPATPETLEGECGAGIGDPPRPPRHPRVSLGDWMPPPRLEGWRLRTRADVAGRRAARSEDGGSCVRGATRSRWRPPRRT